jgi:hypothetical protein
MSEDWTTVTPQAAKEEEKVEFEIENEASQEEEVDAQPQLDLGDAEDVQQTTQEQGVAEENEEKESGAQKRIRQLVRQRKEREQQIEELKAREAELQARLKAKEKEYAENIKSNLDHNERSINDKLELSKHAYRQAVESGDADKMLAAQEAMSSAQAEAMQLKQSQYAYQKYQQELEQQAQQVQQPQQQADQYDPKAISWAARNPWFGQDNVLTQAALQIDASMKDEGYDPSDEEYYSEIDKRLASAFPTRFEAPTQQVEARQEATAKASQVVAGASRTPNPSSGRKVKLSQEDVRLAEKWGIPLEQYAAEKLKVERADGEYTSINNQRGGY